MHTVFIAYSSSRGVLEHPENSHGYVPGEEKEDIVHSNKIMHFLYYRGIFCMGGRFISLSSSLDRSLDTM